MPEIPSQGGPYGGVKKTENAGQRDKLPNERGESARSEPSERREDDTGKGHKFLCTIFELVFWPHDPERTVARFTIWLTIIAALGLWIAYDTLIRGQRAWIAPAGIFIDGNVVENVPLTLRLKYENIGKEPAINVRFGLAPIEVRDIPVNSHNIPVVYPPPHADRFVCSETDGMQSGVTAFPAPERRLYETLMWVFTGGERNGVSRSFLEKRESLIIQGCIIYQIDIPFPWLGNPTRHSYFCYYLQPKPDPAKPEEWEFFPCFGGQQIN